VSNIDTDMSKILISWLAFNNDFNEGKVNKENSPNYAMHKYFYKYDKHILLSTAKKDDIRLEQLLNVLHIDFPSHNTEGVYMNVEDVIDYNSIKSKVERKLQELKEHEIDIYFSPGTSIMQVSWFVCHTTLGLKTHLLQTRPPKKSKSGKPELLEIVSERSITPYTAIINEIKNNKEFTYEGLKNYKITNSIKSVYDKAYKISQADGVTTLIFGESGTGKEHLAKFIHKNSARKTSPFVAINCSAFGDNLLESRLFGYKKGAFTGAEKDSIGLFEEANKGTIFMDEIGDISPYMQQSLLRVLQEKEISQIGGITKKIDVRVIAATNKNLNELCSQGKFRWDLYYRLIVTELELPTICERGKKETEEMLDFFINEKKVLYKRAQPIKLSKEARTIILNYSFPGNIREIENLVEHLYVFCETNAGINNIPNRIKFKSSDSSSLRWNDVEKALIEKVLKMYKGNQRQAFIALGYGAINTLRKKIKDYNIEVLKEV